MPANLIKTADLVSAARKRGFTCRVSAQNFQGDYVEIGAPDQPITGGWHNGCQYVGAFAILKGAPGNYAYNSWFYGPFHPGYVRRDSFGVQKLLAHPAMAGVALPNREG
jgi:hypothetical protein